jgi:1,4-dihydroxy-2-naphthoate octaprenyltransferase
LVARPFVAAARAFVRLSRVKFLMGGLLGVALGTVVAAYERGGRIDWRTALWAQAGVTAFQLMTHYANDYFDRDADVRAQRTPFSGGSGVLVDGSLAPAIALRAALTCLLLGLLACGVLFSSGRSGAGLVLLAIAAGAWAYSAPPLRLLARGLGELDTALVVAVLVPLAACLAQGITPGVRMLASTLPGAAAMFAMMLCVEAPDSAVDAASGKRNLLVRNGRRILARWGPAAVVLAFAGVALALGAGAPPTLGLLQALSLPPGVDLGRAFGRSAYGLDPYADAGLAARGVTFFFLVGLNGVLGYAAALAWRL